MARPRHVFHVNSVPVADLHSSACTFWEDFTESAESFEKLCESTRGCQAEMAMAMVCGVLHGQKCGGCRAVLLRGICDPCYVSLVCALLLRVVVDVEVLVIQMPPCQYDVLPAIAKIMNACFQWEPEPSDSDEEGSEDTLTFMRPAARSVAYVGLKVT